MLLILFPSEQIFFVSLIKPLMLATFVCLLFFFIFLIFFLIIYFLHYFSNKVLTEFPIKISNLTCLMNSIIGLILSALTFSFIYFLPNLMFYSNKKIIKIKIISFYYVQFLMFCSLFVKYIFLL